jgi:hypothetical protein
MGCRRYGAVDGAVRFDEAVRMSDALVMAQCLLRHPVLIAEILLLAGVLFGAGRAVGLPLLFWHERRGDQFLAGLSATVLMGEVFFVAYLSDQSNRAAVGKYASLSSFLVTGGFVWGAVVVSALTYRWVLQSRSSGGSGVVTPRFHRGAPTNLVAADPPMWPFPLGVALGVVIVYGLVTLAVAEHGGLQWVAAHFLPSNVTDPSLHAAAVLAFLLMLMAFLLAPVHAPAVEICLLLGMIAAGYGGATYWLNSSGAALGIAVTSLTIAGIRSRRLQIGALRSCYSRPLPYPPRVRSDGGGRPALLPYNIGRNDDVPRPLILVCASGGGIRAATWTAAILAQLNDSPNFRPAVRLITGASGGMVGSAVWVASLQNGGTPRDIVAAVAGDALSAAAHRLVYRDIPFAFLPFINDDNRGQALEQAWNAHTGGGLSIPLGSLRAGELAGTLPSLVFSPMIVEDGRRLIVSNLDLSALTTSEVRWLGHSAPETASRSAFHIEDLIPGTLDRLPLSTAARLSASFPYVSPAAVLPTTPSRRVVDAGYYDNYGLSLACEWLRQCLTHETAWFTRNVSKILLLQIRDNVSELSVDGEQRSDIAPQDRHRFGRFSAAAARGFEWLTSPISGVLSARDSVMLFRNDAALEAATQLSDSQCGPGFLSTTIFEFKGEASLSWYLTRAELEGIRGQVESPAIRSKIGHVFEWLEQSPGRSQEDDRTVHHAICSTSQDHPSDHEQ